MSALKRPLIRFFGILAAAGLVLSIISHLAGLLGFTGPLGDYTWLLHVGIFVVWLPTVLVAKSLTKGSNQRDFWKVAFRGCPPWVKYAVYGFFGYAFVNFFLAFIVGTPTQSGPGPMPPDVVRGFSGHWMVFYSAAAAVLYSADHVKDSDQPRRCVLGHPVDALARFCSQCGQPVVEDSLFRTE